MCMCICNRILHTYTYKVFSANCIAIVVAHSITANPINCVEIFTFQAKNCRTQKIIMGQWTISLCKPEYHKISTQNTWVSLWFRLYIGRINGAFIIAEKKNVELLCECECTTYTLRVYIWVLDWIGWDWIGLGNSMHAIAIAFAYAICGRVSVRVFVCVLQLIARKMILKTRNGQQQ